LPAVGWLALANAGWLPVVMTIRNRRIEAGVLFSHATPFVMSSTLMSANAEVVRVHACHLNIGDQKNEGRQRHRNARQ
jgi:hypothetical protein